MNDDFFADWTNLGADDDVDDPFNETQNVSQPAVPQAPPQQAPTMQQAAAYVPPAPQSIQNPVPQYPGMEPQHPAAPTAAAPAFSNAPAFGTAPSETGHGMEELSNFKRALQLPLLFRRYRLLCLNRRRARISIRCRPPQNRQITWRLKAWREALRNFLRFSSMGIVKRISQTRK